MKIKIVMISFMSFLTLQAYAANKADAHIAKAKALIGSIKNNIHHKARLNKITNNRPAGMPGVISSYQARHHEIYTGKINDAAKQAKDELSAAKADANDEQLKTIALLSAQIEAL